jgi:hypothetical protein
MLRQTVPTSPPSWIPLIALSVWGLASSCAHQESARAQLAAGDALRCPKADIEAVLLRETPAVREWGIACDFTYTRVHCTDAGCRRAEPKPPCMGELTCFEENPTTLAWEFPRPPGTTIAP